MRLRRTALPSAFLMLQPKRLRPRPLGRTNTVNSRLLRRRPSRYTASYWTRCTRRQARGSPSPGASDARKTVASLAAALRKDFSSTLALHPCAEAVLLVARAHMGLIGAFRQRFFSSGAVVWVLPGLWSGDFPAGALARAECGRSPVAPYASRTQVNQQVYATLAARSRKCSGGL